MLFGWFYFDWTVLLVIPVFFFSLWAQFKVNSTFKKYSQTPVSAGISAANAARRVLDAGGVSGVSIEQIRGELTDHFDPKAKVIRLSDAVHNSHSAAAIGVAAHEAGHAIQYSKGYFPMKLRAAVIPATKIGSMISIPLFFIGLIMASEYLMTAGIILYSTIALFQLITLPVEFNASKRALRSLEATGILRGDDLTAAKKVLSAAALTYVAALATSLMTLLRLVLLASGGSRRRR